MLYVAGALIVVGVVLMGSLDGWRGVLIALGSSYLGLTLVLLSTVGLLPSLVSIAVAVGVVGVLLTFPSEASPTFHLSPLRWSIVELRPRWFELSVTAVAMVGALALAMTRPIFGSSVDPAVDVLLFTGLLNCLVGRSPRIAGGLLLLAAAGSLAVQEIGQPTGRLDLFMLAVVQVALALVLTRLRALEEQRPTDRSAPTADGNGVS